MWRDGITPHWQTIFYQQQSASKLADDTRIDLSMNLGSDDLSSEIKTDFGGCRLISKWIIFGMLEKFTVDNLAKNWCDLCMSQQILQVSVLIFDIGLKF